MSDLNIPDGLDVPKVREYETHRICGAPTTEHPDGLWHTVERTIADAAIAELLGLVEERDRMLKNAEALLMSFHDNWNDQLDDPLHDEHSDLCRRFDDYFVYDHACAEEGGEDE